MFRKFQSVDAHNRMSKENDHVKHFKDQRALKVTGNSCGQFLKC